MILSLLQDLVGIGDTSSADNNTTPGEIHTYHADPYGTVEGKKVKDDQQLCKLMALPSELCDRLSIKRQTTCAKISCTNTFCGPGKVQKLYYEMEENSLKGSRIRKKASVLTLSFCSVGCASTHLS